MIHFITGKPGGGKSYYAVKQLVKELELSERWIVTNLPLNMEELADYCHKNIEKPVDLKRIRILQESEVHEFWRHYPGLTLTARCKALGERAEDVTDFAELEAGNPGTLFIIDEVHLYFSARQWQKISIDCEFFFSQHRKLKSDVLLITQHCEKVDKNMRRNAQDFTVLRNMETEKLWLGVTFKKTLRRATYLQQPVRNDTPMESGFFRLDVSGLGKLYNTAAGVGIVGRLDVRPKTTGRGVWVWGVVIIGVAAVAFMIPKALGLGARKFVEAAGMSVSPIVGKAAGVDQGPVKEEERGPVIKTEVVEAPAKEVITNKVWVSAVVPVLRGKGGLRFQLSDGREFDYPGDGVVVNGRNVWIEGERFKW